MFERYTEKSRRVIFFARYEASQFGSSEICAEHLLLGLFREDKALASQFLASHARLEEMRRSIAEQRNTGLKIATSVDLPLSHESKRVLAYAAEEAERMRHKEIETAHLLIGLLREEKSFAAQLLREQGLTLGSVRERVREAEPRPAQDRSASLARLDLWLVEREAQGRIWTVKQKRVGNSTTHCAIYATGRANADDTGEDLAPAEKLAQIRKRIDFLVEKMEHAIANHEFENARLYSEEERKEREKMSLLCERFHLEEPPSRAPLLCIEIIHGDRFSEVQKRCDDYIGEGVAEVWLLDPGLKRAYTVTRNEGLREFKGEILRIANPPLEMDLKRIFD